MKPRRKDTTRAPQIPAGNLRGFLRILTANQGSRSHRIGTSPLPTSTGTRSAELDATRRLLGCSARATSLATPWDPDLPT
eukprot:scaffold327_cov257-Pinguiococcus_pyrenoidosus.AAC.30